jgi:hypothetical protein
MNDTITYVEQMDTFLTLLRKILMKRLSAVESISGRKFDRIMIDDATEYFVDKNSRIIYGAKSPLQYNPRRSYGTIDTVEQFDWTTNTPIAGTPVEAEWQAREDAIQSAYKKRGRPRKVVTTAPVSV